MRAAPLVISALAIALAAPAWAQADAEVEAPDAGSLEERLARVEAKLKEHEELAAQHAEDSATLRKALERLQSISHRFSGYADVGLFFVSGDGSGIRSDTGFANFPEYAGSVPDSWVFMGDPLSTAINSRGEPADTSESRAITFDPVHNKGKASFLVNAVNFSIFAGLSEDLSLNASLDFVPRSRNISDASGKFLGDFLDVRLAYAEYRVPIDAFDLSLFAGKFDSVLGVEYRSQDSPDRLTVTPSLICRYTCGRPLGVKARGQFVGKKLAVNLAVTNGSNFIEAFPFSNELDTNNFKTVSGRLSLRTGTGSGLEVGISGAAGAQDFQTSDDVFQWHYGFDLHLDWKDFDVSAEFVIGRANGSTEPGGARCGLAPCLKYRGAYGLIGYRVTNWFTPYVRVDWRDALHQSGASFVYISQLVRATGGLRFELGESVIVKAEFTFNEELGRIPQFDDDVFTSSLVLKY